MLRPLSSLYGFFGKLLGYKTENTSETLSFVYVVPYLPPSNGDWRREILIYNPNQQALEFHAEVWGGGPEKAHIIKQRTYRIDSKQNLSLTDLIDDWQADNWLRLRAEKRLGGTTYIQAEHGEQRNSTPLTPVKQGPTHLIFQRIPDQRSQLHSGMILLNTGTETNVRFSLWREGNISVSPLLRDAYAGELALKAGERRLICFESDLFDEGEEPETVAWIEVESKGSLCGLKWFANPSGSERCDLVSHAEEAQEIDSGGQLIKMSL